jgi:hypothetical protein
MIQSKFKKIKMTPITNSTTTKKILSGMLATMMLLTFYSCAKKSVAVAKTEIPSATVMPVENKGQVQIKRDATGNYIVQINLRELEAVNKLEATSKKAYIVWMNADNEMTKNLGQINSNSGWLSDKSKASFEAVSASKPTKIFITEEDMAEAKKPGIKIIWSTNSF